MTKDYNVTVLSNSEYIRDLIISYLPDNFYVVSGLQSHLVISHPCDIVKWIPQPVIITFNTNEFMKMCDVWGFRNNHNCRSNYISIPFDKSNLIAKINQLKFIVTPS